MIKAIQVGMIGTNCYIVSPYHTNEALVIDPGDEAPKIFTFVKNKGLKISAIVNTHGHWDHVGGNHDLKKLTGAPILIHEADAAYLTDGRLNMGSFMGQKGVSPAADRLLHEGDIIHVGEDSYKVIHTPGHTPGGISLIGEKEVFVGDTLFAGSVGRTDLPGGSFQDLIHSIKNKLLLLKDEIMVYPGHGPSTTIGRERTHNSFLVD